jgi:hypothetical protein
LHRAHLRLIHGFFHLVTGARRPGKIVNIVGMVGVGFCVVGIVGLADP